MEFVNGFVGVFNSKGFGEVVAIVIILAVYFGAPLGFACWFFERKEKP